MSHRGANRLAWSACGLAFAMAGFAVGLAILNGLDARLFSDFLPGLALDAVAFSTLGAVIASRRPEHRIGWLLCAAGVGAGLEALASQYARFGLITQPGALPGAVTVAWFGSWAWVIAFALPVELLLILFPTGRLPSASWRPWAWLSFALLLAMMALTALSPVLLGSLPLANRFGLPSLRASEGVLQTISAALLVPGLLLGLSSIIVRFRHAQGVERQQLKWFVFAAILIFVGVDAGPTLLLQSVLAPDTMLYVNGGLGAIAFPCLASAVGIAILRYRLYDIDLIIRRTLIRRADGAARAGLLGHRRSAPTTTHAADPGLGPGDCRLDTGRRGTVSAFAAADPDRRRSSLLPSALRCRPHARGVQRPTA